MNRIFAGLFQKVHSLTIYMISVVCNHEKASFSSLFSESSASGFTKPSAKESCSLNEVNPGGTDT